MIEALLALALRHRWMVLVAACVLTVVGAQRAQRMPIDVFPDLTAPRVTIVTESSGTATEEVEQLITLPLEAAVNGVSGVRRVRSASAPGISLVWVEFDWQTDTNLARQRITERMQSTSAQLPAAAHAPSLAPATSVMGEIAFVAVTSETLSGLELRRIAEQQLRRRLLATRGVAQAVAIGGALQEFQVIVDPQRSSAYGMALVDVVAALRSGSRNAPGGYLVEGGRESVLRVLGRARDATDLEAMVLAQRGGVAVHLRDLAEVRVGPAPRRGSASYSGQAAVLLSVVKQPAADTVATTDALDASLDALEPLLKAQGVELHRNVFRQRDFIDTAIENLVIVLRDGSVLVVLVLWAFLWSLRPTLISLVSLPLSLVVALLILEVIGLRIDTMTLGGLAIAIGELVDDAIVDVENVVRRLRERESQPVKARRGVIATVFAASLEVRSAIVSATWVIMLVFVPLLLLDGLEGRLMRPLATAYLVAIFASLIVAVTVTPVLCSFILPRSRVVRRGVEAPLVRLLAWLYRPILGLAIRRTWLTLTLALAVVAGGVYGFRGLGRSFLPEFNEGSLTISMVLQPGTSLEQSDAVGRLAERALLADAGVLSVGRRTGRAEADEHVQGVETSELEVRVDRADTRTRGQLFADLRQRLEAVPGARFSLGQPISHRIEHMLSGQRSALSIRVFGHDLRELRDSAKAIEAEIRGVSGLVDLNVEQIADIPQVIVEVDAEAAASFGYSMGQAAEAVSTALWGQEAGVIYESHRFGGTVAIPVRVRYAEQTRDNFDKLAGLQLTAPSGAVHAVAAIARIRRSRGPNYILRENLERRVVVTANIAGGNQSRVVDEVRRRVESFVKLADGQRVEYAGAFARADATQLRLAIYGGLALLGIALVVGTTLRSFRRTVIVLVNLPLALAGGVVGVHLAGGELSVATTIGFITLFGIATRNGILLATRAADLELEGEARRDAVTRAAQERLAPILMTALTAALGLLPLGMALGQPGSEIQAPMALVILTGLASSTLLNMLVVPALLARWGGVARGAVDEVQVLG